MASDIMIGQYFPANSMIHKLDPRIKIILTFLYIVLVFTAQNLFGLSYVVLALAFMILMSSVSFIQIWKILKPMLPVIIVTSVLNAFFAGGDYLFRFYFIHLSKQGLHAAIFLSVRLTCLIAGSSLLTYTTSMDALSNGIESLLAPLKRFHVKSDVIAMTITIALRFVPTLIEEIEKITNAQKARGADFESGGFLKRVKAHLPIIIPLFISSFRRADELSNAIECRCYCIGRRRTKLKELHIGKSDIGAVTYFVLSFILVIFLNIVL